jgi:hypothetical protein
MTRTRRTLFVAFALTAVLAAVLLSTATRATPHVRDQVVTAFNERFDGEVALEVFQVRVFPRPEVAGAGLVVRLENVRDAPPILRLGRFEASAGALGLLATPVRLRTLDLERLEIHIPPGGVRRSAVANPSPATGSRPPTRLTIDEIVSHVAQLRIASKEPGKLPRTFDIQDLHIYGYGKHGGADFRATLTNPIPEGRVDTHGRFGPWQPGEPRATPLRGQYTFSGADMNTIKGLGGTLTSRGAYDGVLDRIAVAGEADVPDFSLDIARRPLPLATRFQAVVDGTNGNTYLERVDATLLESHIHASGAVVRTEDVKGRHVALDITIDRARIEDLLRLVIKGENTPLTGAVQVRAKFLLPAGDEDVIRKLRLDGEFSLDQARFTKFDVQKRIDALSRAGKGSDAAPGESVVSALRGRFVLKDAALSFSQLTFAVPGAMVRLAGTLGLESEELDFTGDLLLDASLRETTSGAKALLAAVAQPFFRRKGGGTRIPIRVRGTRDKPEFGVDVKRALLPG